MVDGHAFGQCRARPVDRIQGASGALHGTEDPVDVAGEPIEIWWFDHEKWWFHMISWDYNGDFHHLMGFNGL